MNLRCGLCGSDFTTPHGLGNHRRWHRGPSADDRFWSKADRSGGPQACWPWTGASDPEGYGKLWVAGKNRRANRLALAKALGRDLAPGEESLHRCDNPPCVNPAHLFVGTPLANVADRHAKGRDPRGERNRHAKLTADQVMGLRQRFAVERVDRAVIAAELGVSRSTVDAIAARKTWRHLPLVVVEVAA